jgi:DNA-binding CsgD family transcriptional regulator
VTAALTPSTEPLATWLRDFELVALTMLAEGASYAQVARRIGKSRSATTMMLHRLYRRMGAVNQTQAVAMALRARAIS